MKKVILSLFVLVVSAGFSFAAEPISGVWKTIDDETNEPKSLVRIYEYDGQYYGRVIKLFKDPELTAKGIKGSPKIEGLDIIWNMHDSGEKFTGGKILDPKKGKIYTCEIWKNKDGSLTIRGKIGPFGRNQIWLPENTPTQATPLVPSIPEED